MSRNGTSSPASRDRISWTRAIDRTRRTDSSMAALASGDSSRRPWRRSSDEIVCRLFFTRWWISRIVASLDSSSRSRRRSSEMSRRSTTAPVTVAVGEQRDAAQHDGDLGAALDLPGDRHRRRRRPAGSASRRGRARRGACPRRWRARRCGAAPTRRSATSTRPASARRARSRRRRRGAGRRCRRPRCANGNSPCGDHPGEAVEHVDVGAARARPAGGRTSASTPW